MARAVRWRAARANPKKADQGHTTAADDGDAWTKLIVEPAGERGQNGSDRRTRQHH